MRRGPMRRRRMMRGPHPGGAFVGLMFVMLGMVFLFDNLGYFSMRDFFRSFWPSIFIVMGIAMLLRRNDSHGARNAAFIWIFVGAFFLLNMNVFNFAFRTIWPMFLLIMGGLVLWRAFGGPRYEYEPETTEPRVPAATLDEGAEAGSQQSRKGGYSSDSTFSATAVMARVLRRNNSQEFRGGDVTAFMGGCEIDLRAASPAHGEAVIDIFSFMGGVEIRVPPDWIIVSNVNPIMGGFEDYTDPPKDASKRLVLRGYAVMGGVEVTN
jgi:predicted membrane protein